MPPPVLPSVNQSVVLPFVSSNMHRCGNTRMPEELERRSAAILSADGPRLSSPLLNLLPEPTLASYAFLKMWLASDHIGSAHARGPRHPWKQHRRGQRMKVLPPCAPHETRGSTIASDQRCVRSRSRWRMRASHRSAG